jgi:hypothetical protein
MRRTCHGRPISRRQSTRASYEPGARSPQHRAPDDDLDTRQLTLDRSGEALLQRQPAWRAFPPSGLRALSSAARRAALLSCSPSTTSPVAWHSRVHGIAPSASQPRAPKAPSRTPGSSFRVTLEKNSLFTGSFVGLADSLRRPRFPHFAFVRGVKRPTAGSVGLSSRRPPATSLVVVVAIALVAATVDRRPMAAADSPSVEHLHGKRVRVRRGRPPRPGIQAELQRFPLLPWTSPSSRLRSISTVSRHRVQYERSMECAGRWGREALSAAATAVRMNAVRDTARVGSRGVLVTALRKQPSRAGLAIMSRWVAAHRPSTSERSRRTADPGSTSKGRQWEEMPEDRPEEASGKRSRWVAADLSLGHPPSGPRFPRWWLVGGAAQAVQLDSFPKLMK